MIVKVLLLLIGATVFWELLKAVGGWTVEVGFGHAAASVAKGLAFLAAVVLTVVAIATVIPPWLSFAGLGGAFLLGLASAARGDDVNGG